MSFPLFHNPTECPVYFVNIISPNLYFLPLALAFSALSGIGTNTKFFTLLSDFILAERCAFHSYEDETEVIGTYVSA